MCHSNLGLLEALLSTIFRPKNIYCIYVDGKSPKEFKKAVKQLAAIYQYHFPQVISIFPPISNYEKKLSEFFQARIIVPSNTIRIYWSDVSILEAGLQCMQALLNQGQDWDFFINTVGSALPGRPIHELTSSILKDLNGDVIPSVPMTPMVKKYTEFKQKMPRNADRFNFDKFESSGPNSMYHEELIPYRTSEPKDK